MDLSAADLIYKYYSPYENEIKKIFSKSPRFDESILSFIDVADRSLLLDTRNAKVITDQLIAKDIYDHKTICQLPDSIFGIYYIPDHLDDDFSVDLDFNLFINRADANRLRWFYKIFQMGWLDSSAVSYIGSTERSTHPNYDAKEFVDFLHHSYYHPNFEEAYHFLQSRVPYQNFNESGDLRKVMIRTKLSVVIETYHERTDAIAFSEKIFRAIQVPRPWVLSGATGSVDRLRSMGIDVFDDYVDHSYDKHDTSQDTVSRDCAILEEVERFRNLKITQSILRDWNSRYQKNLALLTHWHQTWRRDLDEFITKHF